MNLEVSKLKFNLEQDVSIKNLAVLSVRDLFFALENLRVSYKIKLKELKPGKVKIRILLNFGEIDKKRILIEFVEIVSVSELKGILKKEIPKKIKPEIAIFLYKLGELSFGEAKKLSGLNIWEFLEKTKAKKIPIEYTEEEFEEDLATVRELLL